MHAGYVVYRALVIIFNEYHLFHIFYAHSLSANPFNDGVPALLEGIGKCEQLKELWYVTLIIISIEASRIHEYHIPRT